MSHFAVLCCFLGLTIKTVWPDLASSSTKPTSYRLVDIFQSAFILFFLFILKYSSKVAKKGNIIYNGNRGNIEQMAHFE